MILFIGSMHDDPSGRERLHRAILGRLNTDPSPALIAFEWARSTYGSLVQKRADLQARLKEMIPQLKDDFVAKFSATLGYEGDLCQIADTRTEQIWMLNGWKRADIQIPSSNALERAIAVKIFNLKDWLLPRIPDWQTLSADEMLSKTQNVYTDESRRIANLSEATVMLPELETSIRSGREPYLFASLEPCLAGLEGSGRLGLIIVGAAHLSDVPGSLFMLCKERLGRVDRRWPHEQ